MGKNKKNKQKQSEGKKEKSNKFTKKNPNAPKMTLKQKKKLAHQQQMEAQKKSAVPVQAAKK